jgi:ABC-2 type transport system ATP-binding protein
VRKDTDQNATDDDLPNRTVDSSNHDEIWSLGQNVHVTVIEARGVTKRFGSTVALDGFDIDVREGQIHGFLGPNGAGKSTMLRILLGLMRADGGKVTLLGGDPWHDAVSLHRRVAYVPGDVTLWPNLTGGETIDLLGRLHGGLNESRLGQLVERFELDPTRRGRAYSKGNRQKVVLIAALACDAEVMLLDEPTSGLDPLMEEAFRDCLEEQRSLGRTILLSSHLLGEVERLCDHVTIIRAGRAVESGSLEQLEHLTSTTVTIEFEGQLPAGLSATPGIHDVVVSDGSLTCQVDAEGYNGLVAALASVQVRQINAQPPTIEQIFLRYYSDAADR